MPRATRLPARRPENGNVAAVQRYLGRRKATYAMQYMWVSEDELDDVVNDRSG